MFQTYEIRIVSFAKRKKGFAFHWIRVRGEAFFRVYLFGARSLRRRICKVWDRNISLDPDIESAVGVDALQVAAGADQAVKDEEHGD